MRQSAPLRIRQLGTVDYARAWRSMRRFSEWRRRTSHRHAVADELWLLQHPPVFTLGAGADPKHCLRAGDIPLLRCDRGGQITYHGPGQLIAYWLCDLRRARIGVRELARGLEQAAINTLVGYGIRGARRAGAPGVYVGDAKIAALGLRVRHGLSYHGLSLNVNCDLAPFSQINPCGHEGLAVTSIAEQCADCPSLDAAGLQLARHGMASFGYHEAMASPTPQRRRTAHAA